MSFFSSRVTENEIIAESEYFRSFSSPLPNRVHTAVGAVVGSRGVTVVSSAILVRIWPMGVNTIQYNLSCLESSLSPDFYT